VRYQRFCVDTLQHGVIKQCLITSINVILIERLRIFESSSKIIRYAASREFFAIWLNLRFQIMFYVHIRKH